MTDRVEINPGILQGKPVIRATRIPVELLLRKLAEGATNEDLLDAHPRLVQTTSGQRWTTRRTPLPTKQSCR